MAPITFVPPFDTDTGMPVARLNTYSMSPALTLSSPPLSATDGAAATAAGLPSAYEAGFSSTLLRPISRPSESAKTISTYAVSPRPTAPSLPNGTFTSPSEWGAASARTVAESSLWPSLHSVQATLTEPSGVKS